MTDDALGAGGTSGWRGVRCRSCLHVERGCRVKCTARFCLPERTGAARGREPARDGCGSVDEVTALRSSLTPNLWLISARDHRQGAPVRDASGLLEIWFHADQGLRAYAYGRVCCRCHAGRRRSWTIWSIRLAPRYRVPTSSARIALAVSSGYRLQPSGHRFQNVTRRACAISVAIVRATESGLRMSCVAQSSNTGIVRVLSWSVRSGTASRAQSCACG